MAGGGQLDLDPETLVFIDETAATTKMARLADQPRMGRPCPEIEPSIRALVASPYLIFYRTRPDDDQSPVEVVDIVAVIDGRRDLEQLRGPLRRRTNNARATTRSRKQGRV